MSDGAPIFRKSLIQTAREAKANKPAASHSEKPKLAVQDPGNYVTHRCGHKTGLRCLEEKNCPACQQGARMMKTKARQEKALDKKESRGSYQQNERLPDGALMRKRYDAEKTLWIGMLTIFIEGKTLMFTGTASGSFRLEINLAQQYWKWQREQANLPV